MTALSRPNALSVSAIIMLVGQMLFILVTLRHAGGDANDHAAIFETYAESRNWLAVHLGQFVAMAVEIAGLTSLAFAFDEADGPARWTSRLAAAAAMAAMALMGVLQAVDGVALKHAVDAWASAPEPDKTARLAAAETIRWLEWGARSYHDFAMCLALALFAASFALVAPSRPVIPFLIGLAALAFAVQAWEGGVRGFTALHSTAIVLGWAANLLWMTLLLVEAFRGRSLATRRQSEHRVFRPSQV